jgi:hypothetical protein
MMDANTSIYTVFSTAQRAHRSQAEGTIKQFTSCINRSKQSVQRIPNEVFYGTQYDPTVVLSVFLYR